MRVILAGVARAYTICWGRAHNLLLARVRYLISAYVQFKLCVFTSSLSLSSSSFADTIAIAGTAIDSTMIAHIPKTMWIPCDHSKALRLKGTHKRHSRLRRRCDAQCWKLKTKKANAQLHDRLKLQCKHDSRHPQLAKLFHS